MKKKEAEKHICVHCQKEFHIQIFWCTMCEAHVGEMSWYGGKDNQCHRCTSGENDDYLKWKVGHDDRVEAAVKAAKDPKNWGDFGTVRAYENWVASERYQHRFDPPETVMGIQLVVDDRMPPGEARLISHSEGSNGELRHDEVKIVGIGSGEGEVQTRIEESGAWSPDEGFDRVFF